MNSIFNPDDIYDIELELTTYCNAGCPLCYRNYKTFKDHYPKYIIRPLEDVKKDMEKASEELQKQNQQKAIPKQKSAFCIQWRCCMGRCRR